jgi:hypothetical protein
MATVAAVTWRDRLLREADHGILLGGWTGRLRISLFLLGAVGALIFGSTVDRGRAAVQLLLLAAIVAAGTLWVWVLHRRAVAARRRRKPPLDLSA